ncbi:MAG TPA: DUF6152 family protein [Vicinamibacterales bacterium]|jgi:hypothetical protein|nr:DUF6152 family protein [Vicinamibacterales bacterium]HXR43472.1 DUF6152 family protein [Pseudolysinimonas sp.]
MRARVAVAAGLLLASVSALSAHHTVVHLFDTSKLVTLQGTLTRVEWREPHVILRLETRRGDGSTSGWNVETRNPQGLAQAGLSRDSFKVGDAFSATVCVAKDGTRWAVTHEIARPGGVAAVRVGGC